MRYIGKYNLKEYIRENGKIPFREWLLSLEKAQKARIQARLLRIQTGNLGDYKSVGNGVCELRFHFDSGLRVYFGIDGRELILLLLGGDKRAQQKDIKIAQALWQEYLGREKNE